MLRVPVLYRHRPISNLEDHEVALVSLVQQLGREYLPGRAEGDDPPVEQEGEIESLRDAREVVCRHHDGRPPLLQTPQEVEDLMLRRGVYPRYRLVQQQHLRPLRQGAREEDALLLPARELPDALAREPGHPDGLQRLPYQLLVAIPWPLQKPQRRDPAHHGDVEGTDREVPVHVLALRYVADEPSRLPVNPSAEHVDLTPHNGHEPEHRLSRVLFPLPLGPTIPTIAPRGTEKLTASRTGRRS